MALRAHDHAGIPMCHYCHMELHSFSGRFKTFTHAMLAEWQDSQIAALREEYQDEDCF